MYSLTRVSPGAVAVWLPDDWLPDDWVPDEPADADLPVVLLVDLLVVLLVDLLLVLLADLVDDLLEDLADAVLDDFFFVAPLLACEPAESCCCAAATVPVAATHSMARDNVRMMRMVGDGEEVWTKARRSAS
jgi:hypothetical protein